VTFRTKVIAGVTAAAMALLAVAVLSYLESLRNDSNSRWVAHTHQVLETQSALDTALEQAEAGQRDYGLTADSAYRESYAAGLVQAQHIASELRQLTSDNPTQQNALDVLRPLLAACPAAPEEHGSAAASSHRFGPLKMVSHGMKQEEQRLLASRSEQSHISSQRTRAAMLTGEALGFLLLLVAGYFIQREMIQRKKAENEVRALNADLERRVAERTAELAERAKELARSNVELQQFAYVASHDLQEPLRTISSFTQLLAKRYRDQLDDKAREFIGFAVDGCKRMQTLINDLLAFSRVGTHGRPPTPVRCDELVDRVLKSLRVAIDDSGAAISRDPLPTVRGDEVQLGQLFQNLVGNALKFRGPQRPKIHIGCEVTEAGWKISVRDNGIGIPEEHHERIFVIFQRLHNRNQYPGTGIGLAICKKIAERHGGRIWVEPTAGGGSTFCFTISAYAATATEELHEHAELRANAAND
jgi:signal transduction histidine kinase